MGQSKLLYGFGKVVCTPIFKVLYRYKVVNKNNIPPEGGYIIACNHLSNIDPVLLGLGQKRRIFFMAKDELFKNKQVQTSAENPTEVLSSEIDLNPGEVLLTGNIVSNADYAADMKMSRQTMRSKNQESLLEIVNNKNISDEQKQNAIDEMVKITQTAEKENNAEIMLEAKGLKNAVVSISEKYCDVVCDMGEVTEENRAQIEDIVKRQTGVAAESIVITAIDTTAE